MSGPDTVTSGLATTVRVSVPDTARPPSDQTATARKVYFFGVFVLNGTDQAPVASTRSFFHATQRLPERRCTLTSTGAGTTRLTEPRTA